MVYLFGGLLFEGILWLPLFSYGKVVQGCAIAINCSTANLVFT